jgi:hypothetical protein
MSRNVTVCMSSVNDQEIEDGVFEEVFEDLEPPCVALVPLVQEITWARKMPLPRPDPSFVTQLIATAEHAPQTRTLRRAAPEDALSAYNTPGRVVHETGLCTRQVI